MKKHWKLILVTVVLLLLTPWFNEMVNQSRTVPGFGGECVIWLMPILCYGLYDTVKGEY